jgi:hypothetical protein
MALIGKKHPDVSTPEGFLEVYDAQARKLERANSWCSIKYAYETTGKEDGAELHRIPRPANRGNQYKLASVPREYLSEAGLAAQTAESGEIIAVLRRGAITAAQYGIDNASLTIEDANDAMKALGIGEFTYSTVFSGYITSAHYFSSEAALTTDQRQAIKNAVEAAINEALGSFSEVITPTDSRNNTVVSTDRGSSRKAIAPAL